jgi:hypothetical protein
LKYDTSEADLNVQVWRCCVAEETQVCWPTRRDVEYELPLNLWDSIQIHDGQWPFWRCIAPVKRVPWDSFISSTLSDEMCEAVDGLHCSLFSRWMHASELVWLGFPDGCKWLKRAAFRACDPKLLEIGSELDDIPVTFPKTTSPSIRDS